MVREMSREGRGNEAKAESGKPKAAWWLGTNEVVPELVRNWVIACAHWGTAFGSAPGTRARVPLLALFLQRCPAVRV